jgi:hypothetical protein
LIHAVAPAIIEWNGPDESEPDSGIGYKLECDSLSATASRKTGNQVIECESKWNTAEQRSATRLDSSSTETENTFDGVAKEMKTQTIQKRRFL